MRSSQASSQDDLARAVARLQERVAALEKRLGEAEGAAPPADALAAGALASIDEGATDARTEQKTAARAPDRDESTAGRALASRSGSKPSTSSSHPGPGSKASEVVALADPAGGPEARPAPPAQRTPLADLARGWMAPSSTRDGEVPLRPEHLDVAEGVKLESSVWDMCLFVGHSCLGWGSSIALVMGYMVNIFVQMTFSTLILLNTGSPRENLGADNLFYSLFRFRLNAGHNVAFADAVTGRSLASQLCDFDPNYSGAHLDLYDDVSEFVTQLDPDFSVGFMLANLAQFFWTAIIFHEISQVLHFTKAILFMPLSLRTELAGVEVREEPMPGSEPEPVKHLAEARVTSISCHRRALALLFVSVPRLVVACWIGQAGSQYLAQTHKIDDLILNAVALGFILECDELVYKVFMPYRVATLQTGLDELPVHTPKSWRCCSCFAPTLKAVIFVLVMATTYEGYLKPYRLRAAAVKGILCSGDTEFVYAVNKATGMVHVSTSNPEAFRTSDAWKHEERVVWQLIGGSVSGNLSNGLRNIDSLWRDLDVNISHPDAIRALDIKVSAVVEPHMSDTLGESPFSMDGFQKVAGVRARSTEASAATLACADLGAGLTKTGRDAALDALREVVANQSVQSCADVGVQLCSQRGMTRLRALCPETCECDVEASEGSWASFFGHPKFGCPTQCSLLREIRVQAVFPDDPLGAAVCSDSVVQDFASEDWWRRYVDGLFEYLSSREDFESLLQDRVQVFDNSLDSAQVVSAIASGTFQQSFLGDSWQLLPGVDHPRNLTGCALLASREFAALLNVNLCSSEDFASILSLCPVSCGCGQGGFDCNVACAATRDSSRRATVV